jgi:diadenosine tetraphosphatase ApaH/serine/threonine PP2A family protein phosphatase
MMTSHFTFRDEVLYKYDDEVYDTLIESFEALPLACLLVINQHILLTTIMVEWQVFLCPWRPITKVEENIRH